ncbi:MAG: BrnA antitoxin family protein [Gammaproteobacteria bacterium]
MKENYDFSKAKRGAIVTDNKKLRISIRLDPDVIAWFKEQIAVAGGGNYQSLINAALREHINHHGEPLESILRRVIREELHQDDAA